jgi:moderate conductance mechanosensitive channel
VNAVRWPLATEADDGGLVRGLLDGDITVGEALAATSSTLGEIVLIVVLAWVASLLARRAIRKAVEEMKDPDNVGRVQRLKRTTKLSVVEGERPHSPRRAQRADALGALAKSVVAVIIWTVALFMVLGALGVELGPLIAGAGIVGVALGFGSQALVKDLISGVFMLVEDQYGIGDIIDAGEAIGVVEGVGLRSTRIRAVDGTLWHVPNGEIRRVGNMSQQWARALLDVGVSYDTDVDEASRIILEVATIMAEEDDYRVKFLDTPEIWGVENLGADSIDIRLVIKTLPGEQWKIARELRARIKKAFDAAGIEIPFPQRTVWVRNEAGAEAPGLTAPSVPDAAREPAIPAGGDRREAEVHDDAEGSAEGVGGDEDPAG